MADFRPGRFMPMIVGEIKRYLRDNNAIRISRSVRDLAYRALRARDTLTAQRGAEPTVEEITAYLAEKGEEHPMEEITRALDAIADPVSLYDPVYGEDEGDSVYVLDQIKDTAAGEEGWLESIALKDALQGLSEREKHILAMRYYRGRTQTEIAEEIGISQAQVSRIEKGALEQIRKRM